MSQPIAAASIEKNASACIAEITCRHHVELAMAWWRRETSPRMLLRGTFAHYLEIDQKICAYMDGAGLDNFAIFEHLVANQNPDAPDFIADLVAVFLAVSVGGAPENASDWVAVVKPHQSFTPALQAAQRWLGQTSVMPQQSVTDGADVDLWHPSSALRFIDGTGQVQGHYESALNALGVSPTHEEPNPISTLCMHLLLKHTPRAALTPDSLSPFMRWVSEANRQSFSAEAIFMAVGISGDANALPWLLQCAVQSTYTICALDAFRRITGLDALQAVQADRQVLSTIEPVVLNQATEEAKHWFQAHSSEFNLDTVYFLGKSITRQHLLEVIRSGYQVDREVAAMRLLHEPQPCLIPVRSNCEVQRRVLSSIPS
ncbi:hypothetical protein [Acidovorax sp. LjRoot117]|uniref:hypothetical protein n=1 Tax=Acidovorax sp. LjRoot117 TaxID=3342255 RepID=UPI003ECDFED1